MADEQKPLMDEVDEARLILDMIKQQVGDDDPDLLTLLESETNVLERLRKIIRSARWDEANAKTCAEMAKELTERKGALENRAQSKRAVVLHALKRMGQPKLQAPDFTASVAKGRPKVVIEDETLVPGRYGEMKFIVSKTAIKEAIEAGEAVPGASLIEGEENLTVRVK